MGGNLSLQKQSRELGLSGREQEIALLMLQGKTNKEISDTLFISMSTTKTHISRIFKKATVSTRSELFFLFYNGDSSVVDG
jgi:DNA-binding CsgD family transcriptional regulator